MKVRNETTWRTDHLRAILQRAAEIELEPAQRKRLIVTVSYTRGHYSSGCAFVRGRHATVRIAHPQSRGRRFSKWVKVSDDDPRPARCRWSDGNGDSGKVVREFAPPDTRELVQHFALVAVHEFAHIRGMHHDTMPSRYKWHGKWREYVAWATTFPLEVKPVKVAAKPTVDDKLAHVLKMKRLAETRVKRATTILKRWKARERYYLKAAQKPRA